MLDAAYPLGHPPGLPSPRLVSSYGPLCVLGALTLALLPLPLLYTAPVRGHRSLPASSGPHRGIKVSARLSPRLPLPRPTTESWPTPSHLLGSLFVKEEKHLSQIFYLCSEPFLGF